MADSTVDIKSMKVVNLKKELKLRGLSSTGDKAELVARLQAALPQESEPVQDEHADINLDSDEIDSDGVLDESEDKSSQHDLLDDAAVEAINEELALAEQPPPSEVKPVKGFKTLKRKINDAAKDKAQALDANKESGSKKIVLNRSTSIPCITPPQVEQTPEVTSTEASNITESPNDDDNKIKTMANVDARTKLELRAKRFGLPVKMSDAERKEARKQRFGQTAASTNVGAGKNVDILKKRAERFGQSVSKFMNEIENKEKLEKRKAKFGTVK